MRGRLIDPFTEHDRFVRDALGVRTARDMERELDDFKTFGTPREMGRPRVDGDRGDGSALRSLVQAMQELGIIVDLTKLEPDFLANDVDAKDAIGSVRKSVYVDPGATTVSRVGLPADPTLTATTSNTDDADGPWLNHATAATTGSASGMASAFTVCRRDWLPDVTFRIKTPSTLSNTRHWIGLINQSMDASEATTGDHVAAFRYSTAVDSSGKWQAVTNDGGPSPTVTDTGVSRSADTAYTMRIRCLASSVEFYINGALVATHTTDLPSASTLLGYAVRAIALANNARSIKWNRMVMSFT